MYFFLLIETIENNIYVLLIKEEAKLSRLGKITISIGVLGIASCVFSSVVFFVLRCCMPLLALFSSFVLRSGF